MKTWVSSIRRAYKMVGSRELKPTEKERSMREIAHRSITALKEINIGEMLSNDNIGMRRPGGGLPGSKWDEVIGKVAKRVLQEGKQIAWEDICG